MWFSNFECECACVFHSKNVGDKVNSGDVLLVVESDKADMDVESFEEGWLAAIRVPAGGSAEVGSTVALMVESEECGGFFFWCGKRATTAAAGGGSGGECADIVVVGASGCGGCADAGRVSCYQDACVVIHHEGGQDCLLEVCGAHVYMCVFVTVTVNILPIAVRAMTLFLSTSFFHARILGQFTPTFPFIVVVCSKLELLDDVQCWCRS
jgi:hypothetical protein